jgi:hypothetical protein
VIAIVIRQEGIVGETAKQETRGASHQHDDEQREGGSTHPGRHSWTVSIAAGMFALTISGGLRAMVLG